MSDITPSPNPTTYTYPSEPTEAEALLLAARVGIGQRLHALDADELAVVAALFDATAEDLAALPQTANASIIDTAITAALAELDTLIAAPALPTVPAGSLTNAQLSDAVRQLRDGAQATRAGAQRVAATLKQTIRLVRGDFDDIT
jgi:hypothetical protein